LSHSRFGTAFASVPQRQFQRDRHNGSVELRWIFSSKQRETFHELHFNLEVRNMVFRRVQSLYPVVQLRDEMDRLVNDFFGPMSGNLPARVASTAGGYPAINVWESGDSLFAEAEVPGLKSEDIDISVVGNDLTVRGQRPAPMQEGVAYHRQERGTGQFNRVLRLPAEVDAARVEATLNDGVLLIQMPKAESAKPKKIKINAGV
jgi:HSP20 family protein